MKTITLADLYAHPDLVTLLEAAARRERARWLGALIGRGLASLFTKHHARAARPRLARQG